MRMRDTLAQLAANKLVNKLADKPIVRRSAPAGGRLSEFAPTGRNPGALGAKLYVPADLAAGAPLVVVLHGCTQTAEGYDAGTGWSHLAERAGFAVLFPEQRRANNHNLCFNWFQSADIARGGGEAASIAELVDAVVDRYALDRTRVFVTGLSAGGAMTAVMLATYPDVFAGGAIIGGLPYACAQSVGEALGRMSGRGGSQTSGIDAVTQAPGLVPARWPRVSIWHGTADATVVIGNLDELAAQWCGVHGVTANDDRVERADNWEHRSWSVGERVVVETWRVAGMGHGVPIDPAGEQQLGAAGAYMLPVGIDSTAEIARGWGLLPAPAKRAKPAAAPRPAIAPTAVPRKIEPTPASDLPSPPASGIQAVIEDALRKAGLMR